MFYFKLTGGLGNQLFQYAAASALNLATQQKVAFYFEDSNDYAIRKLELEHYKLKIEIAHPSSIPGSTMIDRLKRKLNIDHFFREKQHFQYQPDFFEQPPNTFYIGYWQNEKYFLEHRAQLIQNLKWEKPLNAENLLLKKRITNNTNTVAVHVRRGDYIQNPIANQFHGECTIDYYRNAMNYMEQKVPEANYYFFSDDPVWVKSEFNFIKNLTIIDGNANAPAIDLHLMSCCRHQIIANSSFSWWGAWLNTNANKIVIAPKKWTNQHIDCEIVPKEWVTF